MKDGFISPPELIDDRETNRAAEQLTQTAAAISPEKRRFGLWGNLRLARKLLLAFGALFVFTMIIAIVTLTGLNKTQAAYENALAQGIEIRKLSDQVEASLLRARLDEKSSILHWREEGLDTTFTNYVTSYGRNVADMRTSLNQLTLFSSQAANATGDTTQSQYEADIASLNQYVNSYEESFTSLVSALQKKGTNENTDFESEFRIAAGNIETIINGQDGLVQLELTVISLRRSERFYLEQGKQTYVDEVQTYISRLKNQIAAADQLEPAVRSGLLAQVDAYQNAFDALAQLDKEIATYNEELINIASAAESVTARIKTLGEQLAEESIKEARANSTQTFSVSMFTVLAALALSILLAVTFSDQITRPLILLTKVAQEIAEGNFHMYAEVKSADEVGILTHTINNMTVQLKNALQNLENRARELKQQTVEIELTSQQSKKRAQQLQTIAEIARYISTEKDLKKLLPLITETVSEEFGFYHVGIFLLDDSGKYAVLLAANSPGGQRMLQRQHSLEVGQTGLVGDVTATGIPRIVSNTDKDAMYFNNPDLPETHSELALPLKIENRVIGALDIQSRQTTVFSEEDVEALTILADEISIAIDNARLFSQIEKSLAEADAIQRQYSRETWGRLPVEEKISGYRYSIAGVVPLENESAPVVSIEKKTGHEIDVPIIVRGETIGALSVQAPQGERLTADQMDLVKAVAERVGISAENARLFDETTRRAERERIIAEIASKINTSFRTESILRTTATELSQLLDDVDIFINLQATNKDKKEVA